MPFDLSGYGAGGCALLVSPDLLSGVASNQRGGYSVAFAIPSVTALFGARYYQQFLVLDRANRLGLVASNAARSTIGVRF